MGTVVGEVTNTCDEAVSTVLHFVWRDAAAKSPVLKIDHSLETFRRILTMNFPTASRLALARRP